ncbi:S-layer homology domain-containing protein [Heliorestis convoluta]|uniref:S-layer domain protein n=1 Tax=Heliorestis convoluta TaxID=356322 RepID=A0A5Q2MXA8_9FIRM|nr:S-layer homology domain-containing protein [Heliorestis convoluta]QGG47218.1 S-layer domain protein [Heliorestis convoluta]
MFKPRKKRKILAIITMITLSLTMLPLLALAGTPQDIQGHWAEKWIEKMIQKGIVSGYPDGTFQPTKEITRAEFATIVNNALDKNDATAEANFTDVKTSDWYYRQVAIAKKEGYISGYPDGTFKPNQPISRQEAAVLMTNLLKLDQNAQLRWYSDQNQIGNWAATSIAAVNKAGLMQGYPEGTFQPLNPITRAETAVLIDKVLEYKSAIIPQEESALKGIVQLNGQAQTDAKVKLFKQGTIEVIAETTTDQKGQYSFDVEAGQYDLTAEKSNRIGYLTKVDKTASRNIELQAAVQVTGKLTDKDGKSVNNAAIAFTTNPTFLTKTDNKGEYSLYVLPNRSYTVLAVNPTKESDGFQVVQQNVAIGQENTTLSELKATFAVTTPVVGGGGGGGGFGGGGGTGGTGDDSADSNNDRVKLFSKAQSHGMPTSEVKVKTGDSYEKRYTIYFDGVPLAKATNETVIVASELLRDSTRVDIIIDGSDSLKPVDSVTPVIDF